MTVLERVKKLAKKQGLSLQTVAEKAGMGRLIIFQKRAFRIVLILQITLVLLMEKNDYIGRSLPLIKLAIHLI